MKQSSSPLFVVQRESYALRFTCEHCAFFDVTSERCTHGYPNEEHRLARYRDAQHELVFCKDFDLM